MGQQFQGTLSAKDIKRHILHQFDVPVDCTWLGLQLDFAPLRVGDIQNMITLTLLDPIDFRGAGHRGGNLHQVQITPTLATPGYLAGPLPAGKWTVLLDVHMVMPGPDCTYQLEVTTATGEPVLWPTDTPAEALTDVGRVDQPARFDTVVNPNPGWYRGDLHAHTIHSDAHWDVVDLVDAARRLGLDFVTLTDHNTTSALGAMAAYTAPDLLTMGGIELATFWGHAVCLGTNQWLDWRVDPTGDDMAALATEFSSRNGLFIIAHPNDPGDPYCTGCRWVFPAMRPGPARFVEVWNEAWGVPEPGEKNEGGLALWYSWLNAGHRLIATTGSDTHGPAGFDGAGFNVVYAQELSQAGILAGMASGRVYLSSGPELSFTAQNAQNQSADIGGTLAPGSVELQTEWRNAPAGASLRLIRNGSIVDECAAAPADRATWSPDAATGTWFVVELRDDTGILSAVTNPIFID